MRVAIVHYWLINMRGGEKVVEALCELFPDADIFTHVYEPARISETINRHKVRTTFIQKLPKATRRYQDYLPLMPLALEQLDLRDYQLVISSESGPAKGVVVSPDALHLCYCHTPMRYVWDMYHNYREGAGWIKRMAMPPLMHYVRLWDVVSAARVDHFFANSNHVARRIAKYYRRPAEVIPPPVDTAAFSPSREKSDFYLMVGQLVRYKRPDLAVEVFKKINKPLIIIGDGALLPELREKATENIVILGRQPFDRIRDYYARCRALIFPGEEDFGIVPVEAMASGSPVIAYRKGGVLDTVIDGVTGIFFNDQTTDSLIAAIERFESIEHTLAPERIIEQARHFDREIFKQRMRSAVERLLVE